MMIGLGELHRVYWHASPSASSVAALPPAQVPEYVIPELPGLFCPPTQVPTFAELQSVSVEHAAYTSPLSPRIAAPVIAMFLSIIVS